MRAPRGAGAALLAASLTAGLAAVGPAQPEGVAAAQSALVASPGEPRSGEDVAEPVRVRVPRLRIDARLDPLTLNREGELRPPKYGRAGWYVDGPEPGEPGPAVIAGHVDTETGPDVFYRLNDVRKGDRILVKLADGEKIAFRVRRVAVFPRKHFPVAEVYEGPRKSPRLRLITCGGRFDRASNEYESNVVVFAALDRS